MPVLIGCISVIVKKKSGGCEVYLNIVTGKKVYVSCSVNDKST